jgi:D-sedoheptulose 7-phosphate isomerase
MSDFQNYLRSSAEIIEAMGRHLDSASVDRAITIVADALLADKPLLICGNGGSAADAMHIAGELVGRFLINRRPFKAIALSADPVILTAWSNDYSYESVFARQVEAYGEPGGVLLGISTSGKSPNVIAAVEAARRRRMSTIGLTGKGGGQLAGAVDFLFDVPSSSTPLIQQAHLCFYHYLCAEIETRLSSPSTH